MEPIRLWAWLRVTAKEAQTQHAQHALPSEVLVSADWHESPSRAG